MQHQAKYLTCLEYLDQSKSITGLALLAAALDAVAAAVRLCETSYFG